MKIYCSYLSGFAVGFVLLKPKGKGLLPHTVVRKGAREVELDSSLTSFSFFEIHSLSANFPISESDTSLELKINITLKALNQKKATHWKIENIEPKS